MTLHVIIKFSRFAELNMFEYGVQDHRYKSKSTSTVHSDGTMVISSV